MTKPNDQKSYSHEVTREVHHDPQTNGETSTTRTTETVENNVDATSRAEAHHNGYVQGRVTEHNRQVGAQELRASNNAARGLLLGLSLAALAGLVGTALYLMSDRNEPAPVVPSAPTRVIRTAPTPTPAPQKETTIIEKIVPVPQQPAPSPKVEAAPQQPSNPQNINITVPTSPSQPAPTAETPAPEASPSPTVTKEKETTIIDRVVPGNPQPSAPQNINITVPPSQQPPAEKPEDPAGETSPAPSPTPSDDASEQGTANPTGDTAAPPSTSGTAEPAAPRSPARPAESAAPLTPDRTVEQPATSAPADNAEPANSAQ